MSLRGSWGFAKCLPKYVFSVYSSFFSARRNETIRPLCPGCRERDAEIAKLRERLGQLEQRLAEVERAGHRQAAVSAAGEAAQGGRGQATPRPGAGALWVVSPAAAGGGRVGASAAGMLPPLPGSGDGRAVRRAGDRGYSRGADPAAASDDLQRAVCLLRTGAQHPSGTGLHGRGGGRNAPGQKCLGAGSRPEQAVRADDAEDVPDSARTLRSVADARRSEPSPGPDRAPAGNTVPGTLSSRSPQLGHSRRRNQLVAGEPQRLAVGVHAAGLDAVSDRQPQSGSDSSGSWSATAWPATIRIRAGRASAVRIT